MLPRLLVLGAIFTTACATSHPSPRVVIAPDGLRSGDVERPALVAFSSLDELRRLTADIADRRRAELARAEAARVEACRAWEKADNVVGINCDGPLMETVTVTAAPGGSITNVQHDGVDEGGIVKRHGDLLVMLRRGRLFTVRVDGAALHPVDVADVDGGEGDDDRAWYDELLLWKQTAIVIGYHYGRGGTEIALFDLWSNGGLRRRATYHLRSDDYYSSDNYASRLVGDRLVLYTTQRLGDGDPAGWLPAMRRWRDDAPDAPFESIAPLARVFRPLGPLGLFPTVHTQTVCDLAARGLRCEATVLLGDALSVYYASPRASYAWTTTYAHTDEPALLYRLPFDGSAVTAVAVRGQPSSQLAFRERPDGSLHVVTTAGNGETQLVHVPPDAFGPHAPDLPAGRYRTLAHDFGSWPVTQFIGDQVVVAASGDQASSGRVVVARLEGGGLTDLRLTHHIERIEALGGDAVVIGPEGEALRMTALRLGLAPQPAGSVVVDNVEQAESRSHGFFYRNDGASRGVFGVPILTTDSWNARRPDDARIVFVRNDDLLLMPSGTLDADPARAIDDGCRVSCVDWYGNARPVFIGARIFALMGYELVEGRLQHGQVTEVRRLDFTPGRR